MTDFTLHVCVLATVLNRFGVEAGAKSAVCFAANDVTKVESMSSSVIISTKDPQWFQINIAAHNYSTLVKSNNYVFTHTVQLPKILVKSKMVQSNGTNNIGRK